MKNLAITMYRFPGVKTDIYERNVRSFREHNPDAHVDCMTPADFADPYLRRIANVSWRSSWRHSDKVLYDLYRRKPNFEWYLYSEWDVFCNIEMSKMIEPVKDFQVLAHKVLYPGIDDIYWFPREKQFIPEELHPYVAQVAPLAGVAVHNSALAKIAAPHPLHSTGVFCEVRLATLARLYGLTMAQYPLYSHRVSSKALTPDKLKEEGLWHAVKFLVP